MFINERELPIDLKQLEILVRSVNKRHPRYQQLVKDYWNRKSGYKGEKDLDYYLGLTPNNKYHILCNIRLNIFNKYFQMDSLLISPKFVLILESKNYGGILKYDVNKRELLQFVNGEKKRYSDPILQTKRQIRQLKRWLMKYNFKEVMMENLVVISNTDTFIEFDTINESTEKIIYIERVLEKIDELERKYSSAILTKMDINRMSKLFLEHNSPLIFDVLKEYDITRKDIIHGVQCPNCNNCLMTRKYRTWYCPDCKIHFTHTHEKKIIDYLTLFSTITNKECRELLGLPPDSRRLIHRLLIRMNLHYAGKKSTRIYSLPQKTTSDDL